MKRIDISKLESDVRAFFEELPPLVREVALKYPPGLYIMKQDAPYSLSGAGCEVVILSYTDSGDVKVTVTKATEKANEHARTLAKLHGRGPTTAEGLEMVIGPEWLTILEVSPLLTEAFVEVEE